MIGTHIITGSSFNRARTSKSLLFPTFIALFGCTHLQATGLPPQGTILGLFSNPVLTGNVANSPTIGQITNYDNSGTAVYSINNSTDPTLAGTPPLQATGSALNWGAFPPATGVGTFSTVEFFGAQLPSNFHQSFQLGTITFFNGTSALSSLIFGATLSFYDNVVSPSTFLGSDQLIITTTQNYNVSIQQDADYLNICGNSSNICNSSIEAYESTEGGTGVTVNLFGDIVGDPTLELNSVALAPGQSTLTNGYVGSNPPLGTAPEPGTLALAATAGLALVAGSLRRRR